MKKVYYKPRFTVDSFTMSQTIADSCPGVAGGSSIGHPTFGSPTQKNCAWVVGDYEGAPAFFTTNNEACADKSDDGTVIGGCYNNPKGGFEIFGS